MEELPFPWLASAVHTLPNIVSWAVRQRGLPARGAHWPEEPTGLRGGGVAPMAPVNKS